MTWKIKKEEKWTEAQMKRIYAEKSASKKRKGENESESNDKKKTTTKTKY